MKAKAPRPLDGQLTLDPDVPIVRYCRVCGRVLRGPRSIARRIGPTCARRETEALTATPDDASRKRLDQCPQTQ